MAESHAIRLHRTLQVLQKHTAHELSNQLVQNGRGQLANWIVRRVKTAQLKRDQNQQPARQRKYTSPKVDSIELIEGYGSILALNSVRYMSGLKNVWNTNKLGIKGEAMEPFTAQKLDDGKI